MTLLFITQKLHGQDAFGILWIEAFRAKGYDVEVICLEWRKEDAMKTLGTDHLDFSVYSLGKERGTGKLIQILRFLGLVSRLKYDRVFIHMTPVWGLIGAPVFVGRRVPVYLWYTHYKMQAGLRLLGVYAKRLFCATPQSLPQYEGNSKKVVVGHGIDLAYWPKRANHATDHHKLLVVHRLSRSKRLELVLQAMTLLPNQYTLEIFGIDAEKDYAEEMRRLATTLGLDDRVTFRGTIAAKDLPAIYQSHRLILNMASETIDKTMLEALTCGCYPVTTARNAQAIGIPAAPESDTPDAIAAFIQKHDAHLPLAVEQMYDVVAKGHSLHALIDKMDAFIRPGK